MKILGIIPSRYGSSRLPGKPLEMIGDTSLVMRVYNQCNQVETLDKLIVATDDERILDHVNQNGGEAVMTSTEHRSGTERCAEVLSGIDESFDYVVNIQGDEPFIEPGQIEELITLFDGNTEIATLYRTIEDEAELWDPGIPKVVPGEEGRVVYFSRSAVPHLRNVKKENWFKEHKYLKHIGIYGYQSDVLATISKLEPSMIEEMEQLEQLRWIANGKEIKARETRWDSISVDTMDDLQKARAFIKK